VQSIADYAFADALRLVVYCEAKAKPTGWSATWIESEVSDAIYFGYRYEDLYTYGAAFRYVLYTVEGEKPLAMITKYFGTAAQVSIPDKIGEYKVGLIGTHAFAGNDYVTQIGIPEDVSMIFAYAFTDCTALRTVTMPGIRYIGNYAFRGCTALTSATLPDSLLYLKEGAFYACSALTSVTIPQYLTEIGAGAFSNCVKLETLRFASGSSLETIGQAAFSMCMSLKKITLPDSLMTLNGYAFSGCVKLESINIPKYVSAIGENAFNGCLSLKTINFPATNSLTTIGAYAFKGCLSIEEMILPNKVAVIGKNAFEGCLGLKKITLPISLTTIEAHAFYKCTGLSTLSYRGTTAQWLLVNVTSSGNSLFTSLEVKCLGSM
jgi:hypothetical protein